MSPSLLPLFSMALTGAALAVALISTLVIAWRKGTVPLAWAASSLGAVGLAAAVAGGMTRFLDLATVAGVVLVGGVAGAGWAPRGRKLVLVLGLLGLAAGVFARFVAFEGFALAASSGWEAVVAAVPDQLTWGWRELRVSSLF